MEPHTGTLLECDLIIKVITRYCGTPGPVVRLDVVRLRLDLDLDLVIQQDKATQLSSINKHISYSFF